VVVPNQVTIQRSKADQEGKGQTIAILRGTGPFCPVGRCRNGGAPSALSTLSPGGMEAGSEIDNPPFGVRVALDIALGRCQ
jgi:hypothetical protein